MEKTQDDIRWEVELWTEGLELIESIATVNGYEPDSMSGVAIGAVLAALVDEAYAIGLCIGAASKDDKEERIEQRCFRNLN